MKLNIYFSKFIRLDNHNYILTVECFFPFTKVALYPSPITLHAHYNPKSPLNYAVSINLSSLGCPYKWNYMIHLCVCGWFFHLASLFKVCPCYSMLWAYLVPLIICLCMGVLLFSHPVRVSAGYGSPFWVSPRSRAEQLCWHFVGLISAKIL